ncbi:DEAD/DEAH box helicase [Erysipelothrix sp. HDW6C]|uniref:DEAD/DEAH box helicase n=1 Tax=Erysipelothrix sp. HDW6C TaxID=2714930 RepID=UPI00140D2215|nr:DEAD/DEAH box helicase [Erysipelothrix sp. HDW6C]QIK69265.1 DEAD/DEAH box helicase [Erysipelothrix sp. HDW6C]
MNFEEKEYIGIVRSSRNRDIAEYYYYHDSVERISIHQDFQENYRIDGSVSVHGSDYQVVLMCSNNMEDIKYHCPCDYSDEHSACAHIGAVMLTINDYQPRSFPFYYQKDQERHTENQYSTYLKGIEERRRQQNIARTSSMIESFRESSLENMVLPQRNLNIELLMSATLGNFDELILEYKIGSDRTYIIKNITKFIQDVDNESIVRYGKFLTFEHTHESFSSSAKEQIEFLRKAMVVEQSEHYNHAVLGRHLIINNSLIDLFFDTYSNLNDPNLNIRFSRDEIKVPISITAEGDDYRISSSLPESTIIGKANIYFLGQHKGRITIRQIALDEQKQAIKLLTALDEDDLLVPGDQIETFKKYVLATLVDYLEFEQDLTMDVYTIKTYVDMSDEGLIFARVDATNNDGLQTIGFSDTEKPIELERVEHFIKRYASEVDSQRHLAYFNEQEDSTYTFIQDGIDFLTSFSELYVSDTIYKLTTSRKYNISGGVKINNGLLNIDFDSIDIPKDELQDVLRAYQTKKKFHRLRNGDVLNLDSEELGTIDRLLEDNHLSAADIVDGNLNLPMYRAMSLESFADYQDDIQFEFDEHIRTLTNSFKELADNPLTLDARYRGILRNYQLHGVTWLQTLSRFHFGGILADDMGLGKTLQFIAYLDAAPEKNPSIVICPSSVILNWVDEVHKFAPHMKCVAVTGNASEREAVIESIDTYDLVVTSYDYLRRDVGLYLGTEFHAIALDEAQYIKNHNTKNARCVKQLRGSHRFALTGTPIENSLAELWSIFDFIMPGYLFNYHYFASHFERPIILDKNMDAQARLKEMVSPFILRRLKSEVLTELPDKIETVLKLEFEPEEKQLYLANLMKVNEDLAISASHDGMDKIAILAMLTRLRQICCEPRVVYDNITHPSTKLLACVELIETLKSEGKKVLVFSSFTSMLALIQEELNKREIKSFVLEGKTPKTKRQEMVKAFQTDDTDAFLISLKAGGTGINLTAAEAVIHFDPWWNISSQNQATDRAYRFGQKKNVMVYQLIMKDSVEEKIQHMQETKKAISDTFVENSEGSITSMSLDEMKDLFTID